MCVYQFIKTIGVYLLFVTSTVLFANELTLAESEQIALDSDFIPTEEAISLTETTNEAEKEEPQTSTAVPGEINTTIDEPHQDPVTPVELPPEKADEALLSASRPIGRTFTDWQLAAIILALVVAVVMICLGLFSLI